MIKVTNVSSLYDSMLYAVEFCKEHNGKTVEIVVPDKLSLFMEKFLFEKMNLVSSFNIKVVTFNRYAKRNCVVPKEPHWKVLHTLFLPQLFYTNSSCLILQILI